ncbi:hypothetical protein C0991_011901 [Blastosporella zonata]|nr:hypothetical protein C0991_011901 [Blastosporella zonata]
MDMGAEAWADLEGEYSLASASKATLEILKNKEIIAINQDPVVGTSVVPFRWGINDLWTHTDNGTAVRNFTAHQVPAHGVVALLLSDAGDEPKGTQPPCARLEWCMDQNGTRIDNIGFGEGNEDTRRRGWPLL